MKYIMERIEGAEPEKETGFKPFKAEFTIETFEEYLFFNDVISIELTGGKSHDFLGDTYRMGNGLQDSASGDMEEKL